MTRWRHFYFFYKHSGDIRFVSRKTKKAILGRKMTRKELKERLSKVVVERHKYPEPATLSDLFCPKCGCDHSRSTGNMVSYPEVWIREYCMRCGFLVGTADNSPYIHCLELPEQNYEID